MHLQVKINVQTALAFYDLNGDFHPFPNGFKQLLYVQR